MYSVFVVGPAVSCKRNRTSLVNFLIIGRIIMRISQIVPNIWNPLQDTAELVEILELGTKLLSNPNKYGC